MNDIKNNPNFKKYFELDEPHQKVLEGVRYEDGDASIKAGANLAFSGLMIATSILLLSSSTDSILFLHKDHSLLLLSSLTGLLFLFVSAFFALSAIVMTGSYADGRDEALTAFYQYVKIKSLRVRSSIFCSMIGAGIAMLSLFSTIFLKILS